MSKYFNIKTKINGITFASKKEAQYYLLLKQKKKEGEILDFKMQVPFKLQETFIDRHWKKYRPIFYIADFVIYHHGKIEIIDTKGFQNAIFKLKWKILLYQFRNNSKYLFTCI